MKKFLPTLLIFAFAISGCRIVESYEDGVARTRITATVHDQTTGTGFKQEFTKSVYVYDLREQQFPEDSNAETASVLTSDQLRAELEYAFLWKIQDRSTLVELFLEIGPMASVADLVYKAQRDAVRDAVSEYTAAELFSEDRQSVGVRVRELINENLRERGIEITQFYMRDIKPPQAIRIAIEEKLAAEQKVAAEKFQTQVVREQAQQERERATGIRDAQAIIAESLTNQQGSRYLYWKALETMADIGEGSNNMVVVPTENGAPIFFGAPTP